MKHPEFVEIVDLVENRLSASARKTVEAHLGKGCKSCRESRDWVGKTTRAMRAQRLVDAPEYSIQKAVSLMAGRKRPSFAEWIIAKLEFDSALAPQQAGVRSGAVAERQWVFSSASCKIVLIMDKRKEGNVLIGQVTPRAAGEALPASFLIEVLQENRIVAVKRTSDHGEFVLSPVSGRNLELRIHGEPESILVEFEI